MARVRTFLAVDLPADVRQQIARLSREFEGLGEPIKWVEPSNLHVTLKFLGDVEDRELYRVCQIAQQAAGRVKSFTSPCRGVGAFPDLSRPRTIWVGVGDEQGHFAELHRLLEDGFATMRFPRELRPYRPHITLGRQRAGKGRGRRADLARLQERLAELQDASFGVLPVEQVTVYGSELTPEGPVYTRLGSAPLV